MGLNPSNFTTPSYPQICPEYVISISTTIAEDLYFFWKIQPYRLIFQIQMLNLCYVRYYGRNVNSVGNHSNLIYCLLLLIGKSWRTRKRTELNPHTLLSPKSGPWLSTTLIPISVYYYLELHNAGIAWWECNSLPSKVICVL